MFVLTCLFLIVLPNIVSPQATQGYGTCKFPFTYNGKNYTTCTTDGYDFPWCSATFIFTGQVIACSQTISDPCLSGPCSFGVCVSFSNRTFQCNCNIGWTGAQCKESINKCLSGPCLNNGTCLQTPMGMFSCICSSLYTGIRCETYCLTDRMCSHTAAEYQTMVSTDVNIPIPSKSSSMNPKTAAILSSTISGGSLIIAIIILCFCCRHRNKKSISTIPTQEQQQPTYARPLYDWNLSTVGSAPATSIDASYGHIYEEIESVYTPAYLALTMPDRKTVI